MTISEEKLRYSVACAKGISNYSPDPYMKVGCVGITQKGNLVAGVNHAGKNINSNNELWKDRDKRRPFIIHSEVDLIRDHMNHNYGSDKIRTVIITLFPCISCMNLLAAVGVRTIYYIEIYDKDRQALEVARFHGITCIQYKV